MTRHLLRSVAIFSLFATPIAAQSPAVIISAGAAGNAAKGTVPVVPVPTQPQRQMQMPPPEAMIIMIRSSLVALTHANQTNNYTVLNALGSQNFKTANSPARLGEIFAPFRTNKIDLAPVVFVTPQLARQPSFQNGRLRLVGFFPTQPMRVEYDLSFEPEGGIWRLFAISVNLTQMAGQPTQARQTPAPGQR